MNNLKKLVLAGVSALGLLAFAPAAHADSFHGYAPARPVVTVRAPRPFIRDRHIRYAPVAYAPRVVAPVIAVPPSVGYPIAQPAYDDGSYRFVDQVNRELSQIEYNVRARVYAGQLDGSALTTMESRRDDIREDLTDVSQKGFIDSADRAHIEGDVQTLRAQFGC
jgi:hypothetical protein